MTILELNKRMQKIDVNSLVLLAINNNEKRMVNMNRRQLYDKGEDSTGTEIWSRKPYAMSTQGYKQSKGQPYDRVTLKDTGAFHLAFYMQTSGNIFEMFSSDPKTRELVDKYGDDIFGLTKDNKNLAKVFNTKTLSQLWRNKVGL